MLSSVLPCFGLRLLRVAQSRYHRNTILGPALTVSQTALSSATLFVMVGDLTTTHPIQYRFFLYLTPS
uniref:Uncharacterized protein n=2 Tax=Picea TaxID=3328 RepID=A0A101M5F8_PICGL|nr:hypothetical protein ABT39_MTgene1074 [Picea glauca]QHR90001.1 hypothetical protein Q903MT_gene4023 [Picea sitchensis]